MRGVYFALFFDRGGFLHFFRQAFPEKEIWPPRFQVDQLRD